MSDMEKSCIWNFEPIIEERKRPKSWEEFCENFPIKGCEKFICGDSSIAKAVGSKRDSLLDKNILPGLATAEAVLALGQLIQLRNAFNGDWVPDWKNGETKFMIIIYEGEIDVDCANNLSSSILYFKSEQLRDEFLCYFRPLIEKLKLLYGII